MKFEPSKLLIGNIGNVTNIKKNGDRYKHFEGETFAIVKQQNYHDEYIDVLSKNKYVNFHSYWCDAGNKAIINPSSFIAFTQKIYNGSKKYKEIEKITTKIVNNKKISEKEINTFLYFINNLEEYEKDYESKISKKEPINTSNYITNLTKKNYDPTEGIDEYLEKIILGLASDKTNPILIGPNGIGKSTIINALASKIKNNDISKFLKKRQIIDITNLITNTKYAEKLRDDFETLILTLIKNNDIIFIDNIEIIFTLDNCLIDIVKDVINSGKLKVIGTITNSNYNEYFYNSNISKHFREINVNEPNKDMLFAIIKQVLTNYSNKHSIKLFDNLNDFIDNLIKLTSNNSRIKNENLYNDKDEICNPNLVVELIDKIFAHAKANNQNCLNIDNVKYAISSCDKISEEAKKKIFNNLNESLNKKTKKSFYLSLERKKV